MAFPKLIPTARSYTPGDWPVKIYQSMSGAEVRMRYGDQRTGASLQLSYANISDKDAETFLADFNAQKGTYKSFTLPVEVLGGWEAGNYVPNSGAMKYRYSKPPSVQSVRPGVSTVSLELKGVI